MPEDLCFFLPNHRQASCSPYLSRSFAEVYSRRKVSITAENVGEIVQHIRKRYAAGTRHGHIRSRANKLTLTGEGERSVLPGEQSKSWLVENYTLLSPCQSQFVRPASMISQSRWLAFFNSEVCSVRCPNEFGVEFD